MNTTLTLSDLFSLLPLLILLAGALLILLLESFVPRLSKQIASLIASMTLLLTLLVTSISPHATHPLLMNWLNFDVLSKVFINLFLITGLGVTLLSRAYFYRFEASQGEYYFLLLAAILGLILIASAADFLILFLGIETLSISLYVLCGYMKKWQHAHESSIKYFLMGSIAAAFLLYGIALVYGALGTTQFNQISFDYQSIPDKTQQVMFLAGIGLITVALTFEAAIFPFHSWAPDVYEGAPMPITAFMSVGTKAGAFVAFLRIFLITLPDFNEYWNEMMTGFIYATLIYASFVAIRQTQIKRFFAYSGMVQAGFILIPVIVGGSTALTSLIFYLLVYTFATLGAFAVLTFLDIDKKGVYISDLKGLFHRSPFFAGLLSFCLLTLAGIPPTVGFFAKFYVLNLAFSAGYYGLVMIGLLTTILSFYYYLRIIGIMMKKTDEAENGFIWNWPCSLLGTVAVIILILGSIFPIS